MDNPYRQIISLTSYPSLCENGTWLRTNCICLRRITRPRNPSRETNKLTDKMYSALDRWTVWDWIVRACHTVHLWDNCRSHTRDRWTVWDVASHADILFPLGRRDYVTSQKNVCVGGYVRRGYLSQCLVVHRFSASFLNSQKMYLFAGILKIIIHVY